MKHWLSTDSTSFCTNCVCVCVFNIFCFCTDGKILEVLVKFWNILVLSVTFQNIVELVIKDKNHPAYTSEALDDSF